MTQVLLHCCCAPCSSAILEWMLQNDVRPVIFYCNPNIYPEEEYLIRKNEITRYAAELGLTIIDDDYDHESWLRYIAGLENEPERGSRCLECFKYRLLRSALKARALGIDTFTTTLASSRWKRLDQINAAGHWAASQANAPSPQPTAGPQPVAAPLPAVNGGGLSTARPLPAAGPQPAAGPLPAVNGGGLSTASPLPAAGPQPAVATLPAVNGGGPVRFDDRNWRKGGLQERRNELLRLNGFYNQQYCGCEFSLQARQAQEAARHSQSL